MHYLIRLVCVLALGVLGCTETSNGGGGGSAGDGGRGGDDGGVGGDGGAGGTPTRGSVTVAHFAPEVPTAMDTAVVVWIDKEASSLTVTYGTSTGRQALEPGSYTFGLGTATEELVTLATRQHGGSRATISYWLPTATRRRQRHRLTCP